MNRRKKRVFAILAVLGIVAWIATPKVLRHLHAVGLLRAMSGEDREKVPGWGRPVLDLKSAAGTPIVAREYGPPKEQADRVIVLGHGIHHLGVKEPRLRRFAEHLAAQGCHVLTPELGELAAYRVTKQGADVLAASVEYAASSGNNVGLIGFSFAGGMALLAAERAEVSKRLDYVASIGGYHDLGRTLRFLASHRVETPHGSEPRHAHEYGMLVLLNEHLEHFSLGEDHDTFRAALVGWLKEDRNTARARAKELKTDHGRRLFQLIEKQELSTLREQILELLTAKKNELAALSPASHLSGIGTEVLLLHGSGDSVVPREETEWAALELARSDVSHRALVTPLLEHVGVDHPASAYQKWELVHFMAQLF